MVWSTSNLRTLSLVLKIVLVFDVLDPIRYMLFVAGYMCCTCPIILHLCHRVPECLKPDDVNGVSLLGTMTTVVHQQWTIGWICQQILCSYSLTSRVTWSWWRTLTDCLKVGDSSCYWKICWVVVTESSRQECWRKQWRSIWLFVNLTVVCCWWEFVFCFIVASCLLL